MPGGNRLGSPPTVLSRYRSPIQSLARVAVATASRVVVGHPRWPRPRSPSRRWPHRPAIPDGQVVARPTGQNGGHHRQSPVWPRRDQCPNRPPTSQALARAHHHGGSGHHHGGPATVPDGRRDHGEHFRSSRKRMGITAHATTLTRRRAHGGFRWLDFPKLGCADHSPRYSLVAPDRLWRAPVPTYLSAPRLGQATA